MKKVLALLLLTTATAACTTAGPYVTGITSDGNNGLYIEKCHVKLNSFAGTIANSGCTSQHVKVR